MSKLAALEKQAIATLKAFGPDDGYYCWWLGEDEKQIRWEDLCDYGA